MPPLGVVCPNCGTVHRSDDKVHSPISARPGQRVLLDPPVAATAASSTLGSDRVSATRWPAVGQTRDWPAPAQRITIQAGDVWVNDQVVRKPLAVLQSMLVHVHADVHRLAQPADGDSAYRWRSAGDDSNFITGPAANVGWQPTAIGYDLSAGLGPRQADWADLPTLGLPAATFGAKEKTGLR